MFEGLRYAFGPMARFIATLESAAKKEAPQKQAELDLYIGGFDRAAKEGASGVFKFMRGYAEKADNVFIDPRITPVLKLLRDSGYMSDYPMEPLKKTLKEFLLPV